MNERERVSLEHLMQLPLLQGMGRDGILRVAGMVPLNFSKAAPGSVIVHSGDRCDRLRFVMNGQVEMHTRSADGTYDLTEWLDAPLVIQPEMLFGIRTRHTATVRAAGDMPVGLLEVDKTAVRDVLFHDTTFRLNFLNTICRAAQVRSATTWSSRPEELPRRIAHFVRERSTRTAGRKELHISIGQLARELDATRLKTSHALRALSAAGVITQSRSRIGIPDFAQFEAAAEALAAKSH